MLKSEVSFDLVPPTTTQTCETCEREFFCFPWNCLYQILSVQRALEVAWCYGAKKKEETEDKTMNGYHRGRCTHLKKKVVRSLKFRFYGNMKGK